MATLIMHQQRKPLQRNSFIIMVEKNSNREAE